MFKVASRSNRWLKSVIELGNILGYYVTIYIYIYIGNDVPVPAPYNVK